MKPLASIVIPAYNSAKTISKTIEACLSQNYPKDKLEIILADDGSTDNTREIAEKYPVQYLYQQNKGPAAARNLGWGSAKGKFICFTDSDCVPEKDWISKHVNVYNSDTIAGVGGSYNNANPENLLASCIHQEIVQRHIRFPKEVNYLGAFNVSYRKTILEGIGGFDESYPDASSEDNDLAYRIFKKGYKLFFDNKIKVDHYHPTSLIKYLQRQFWHGFWRMKLYKKHSDMISGDVYAGLIDFAKPLLALAIILLLPFIFLAPVAFLASLLLLTYSIMQLFLPLSIIKRTGRIRYLYLIIINFLREYARGLGMFLGVSKFFLYDTLFKQKKNRHTK